MRPLRFVDAVLRRLADRRWTTSPAGCCICGTGGPYYRDAAAPVTRYVYVGACAGTDRTQVDWTACSRHPLAAHVPVVDYGRDVVRTFAQVDADAARAQGGGAV